MTVANGPAIRSASGSGSPSRVAKVLGALTLLFTLAISPAYFIDVFDGLLLFAAIPLIAGAYALWTTDDFYLEYRWLILILVLLFSAASLGLVGLAFWIWTQLSSETDQWFRFVWAIASLAALVVGTLFGADAGILFLRFRRASQYRASIRQVRTGALRLFGILVGGMTIVAMNPGWYLSLESLIKWVSAALILVVLYPSDTFYRRFPLLVVVGFFAAIIIFLSANGFELAVHGSTMRFYSGPLPWLVLDAVVLFIRLWGSRRASECRG